MRELEKVKSTLLVLPTGTGKTVVFSHVAHHFSHKNRVMVLAHREELIRQAASKINAITGVNPGIEMANERADTGMYGKCKFVVSSIQTLGTGRMMDFDPADFALVITDECHHATAPSYRKVYQHLLSGGAKHLGVTATPDRADEEALGQIFQSVAYDYELPDAIRDGWLTPILQTSIFVKNLNYSDARSVAGDFNQGDIARAQSEEETLQSMIVPMIDRAGRRKTIVFATPGNAKTDEGDFHIAERMTEIIERYRPGQVHRISQDTPKDDRRQILRDYADGKFQFLVNVGVLTEGFDDPSIEVVAITRPTKSRSLYAQMIGRGTRPLPGLVDGIESASHRKSAIAHSRKPSVEVIDFTGNCGKHKLVTAIDILGGEYSDQEIERVKRQIEKNPGVAIDPEQALAENRKKVQDELTQHNDWRKHINASVEYEATAINPFDALDVQYIRERGWDKGKAPTENQMTLLKNHGIVADTFTRAQANAVITKIVERQKAGMASYSQVKELRLRGVKGDVTAAQAAMVLGGKNADRIKEITSRYAKLV
jgi:superfamily II DNA or RNA helicase